MVASDLFPTSQFVKQERGGGGGGGGRGVEGGLSDHEKFHFPPI